MPYVDVGGAADRPRLTVLAAVHGTEYTSIAAVRDSRSIWNRRLRE